MYLSLFLHCFVSCVLVMFYSYNGYLVLFIIIITHHLIISPVLINVLSFSGTLYVVCLFMSVAIRKYNIIQSNLF